MERVLVVCLHLIPSVFTIFLSKEFVVTCFLPCYFDISCDVLSTLLVLDELEVDKVSTTKASSLTSRHILGEASAGFWMRSNMQPAEAWCIKRRCSRWWNVTHSM